MNIRKMTAADKPAVMQIIRNTPAFLPIDVKVAEEVLDAYLEVPVGSEFHTFVAYKQETISGYICFGPTPLTAGTWDVYWIASAPAELGKGIGTALLAFAEEKIKEAQGRLILIETASNPHYERAQCFYSARNYDIVCTIPDFYSPGDHKITFRKQIKK